jgi:adenine specific DNA methylase Mod
MTDQLKMEFNFEDTKIIKGFPELRWTGKRPYKSTQYYPAQLKEKYGQSDENDWLNKIFWGDNLQVMSHMLKDFRGKIDLIYLDPPFDSKADYKKKISLRGQTTFNDSSFFEEKQYGDIWTNDEYLQFMYERLIMTRELLSEKGSIYLHCDWHKSHQLRLIMDEVFGPDNFKNEIIWQYQGSWVEPKNNFPKRNQVLLFYTKSNKYTFNITFDEEYVEKGVFTRWNKYIIDGKIYGKFYPETDGKFLPYLNNFMQLYGRKPNDDDVIVEFNGPQSGSVWYISTVNPISPENQKYPTQKPEKLLESQTF